MISGIVKDGYATVNVEFRLPNIPAFTIEFVIDTGLTDYLFLPPETDALVAIGYPKFKGGLGGYARYIAIFPPNWPYGVSYRWVKYHNLLYKRQINHSTGINSLVFKSDKKKPTGCIALPVGN